MDEYKKLYETDSRFHTYVDACVKAEGRPIEMVLAEKTIQNVGDYYKANPKREEPPMVAKMQSGGC